MLKVHVQNKHVELTHIQKLPLEDPSLNLSIPRPRTWFCICNSIFLPPSFSSFKLETSLAARMQIVFLLGRGFGDGADGDDGGRAKSA